MLDTDSFSYYITGVDDFYKDMTDDAHRFDMSDYSGMFAHLCDTSGKKVLGRMKDEFPRGVVTHFCAAKPKMYALKALSIMDGEISFSTKTKAKGIQKPVVKKQMHLSQYERVLEYNEQTHAVITAIRSKKHCLMTEEFKKKALNGFDSKRVVIDAVNTLAHGHKDLPLYF